MIFYVYCIKDNDINEYGKPSLFENDIMAVRFLSQLIINNKLEKIKDKFSLHFCGLFDSSSGVLFSLDDIKAICEKEENKMHIFNTMPNLCDILVSDIDLDTMSWAVKENKE